MADNEVPRASDEIVSDEIVEATVRRAPKYAVFLTLGAAVGIIVAMILTFTWSGTDAASPNTGVEYSQMQVFGFVALISVSAGILLGGLVALAFDRTIGRRTRTISVDRERVVHAPGSDAE